MSFAALLKQKMEAADAAAKGAILVDEKTAEERLAICEGCDQLIRPVYRCNQCGCFMKMKTKLKAEGVKCPLGKW